MKSRVNLEDVAMVARRLKARENYFFFTGGSVAISPNESRRNPYHEQNKYDLFGKHIWQTAHRI